MNQPEWDGASDEDLVRRFQEDPAGPGGQAAATELFVRYRERVYLWCYRRVRNHETALDLAQDALLSAYRALGGFEGRSRYSSWLYTIARHRCFRALRRPGLIQDEEIEPDVLADGREAVDSIREGQEDEEAVLQLMKETLSEREQLALWLRCFENLPVDEITRRLEIKTGTGARGVLQSARRKLREAMENRKKTEERRRT